MNGKIISYDYIGIYGEHETIDYGIVKRFDCDSKFSNVMTDTGLKYEILITYYYTWKEKPEREGISKIRIMDAENSKNRVEVGFIYSIYD